MHDWNWHSIGFHTCVALTYLVVVLVAIAWKNKDTSVSHYESFKTRAGVGLMMLLIGMMAAMSVRMNDFGFSVHPLLIIPMPFLAMAMFMLRVQPYMGPPEDKVVENS